MAERLLRRRDEPVGMIDVRSPQRLHTQTAGWVARRFGMLDHWRTRYGDAVQALNADGALHFTAPTRPSTEIGAAFETDRAITPFNAAAGAAAPAPVATPVLRVSRRPPTMLAPVATVPMLARQADSAVEIEKSRVVEAATPVVTTPIARAGAERPLAAGAEISAGHGAASMPTLIWRKMAEGKAVDGGVGSGLGDFTVSPLPLKIEPAAVPALARKAVDSSVADSGRTADAAPTPVSRAAGPARKIDTMRLAEQVSRMLSRQLAVERERRGIK